MMPSNKNKTERELKTRSHSTHAHTQCLQMFKDGGPPDRHTHTHIDTDKLNPSFHEDNILKCVFWS